MVYLEIMQRKDKKYYYITKSFRISGNKWKKIRQYYGAAPPSEEQIRKAAERGMPVLLITRDRHLWDKKQRILYDELNSTNGINVINNPHVNYLLLYNTETAMYSGGDLDKEVLSNSVLIITSIKEAAKINKIADIFTAMLPTFMR